MNPSLNFGGELGVLIAFVSAVLWLIINLAFALAVYSDAGRLRASRVMIVGPVFWGLAVFFVGPLVAVGYWFLHHFSEIAAPPPSASRAERPDVSFDSQAGPPSEFTP